MELKIKDLNFETISKIKKSDFLFEKLIKENHSFLEKIVLRFTYRDTENYYDFLQISYIALHRALLEYDPNRINASSFSTYSWHVIKNDLLQEKRKVNKIQINECEIEHYYKVYTSTCEEPVNKNLADVFPAMKKNNRAMESEIIDKVAREQIIGNMTRVEGAIVDLKLQNFTMREISQKINMNYHTLKMVYTSLMNKPELKELGTCI